MIRFVFITFAGALVSSAAVAREGEVIAPVPTYVACTENAAADLYSKNRQMLTPGLLDAMTAVALAQCSFDILGLRIVNPSWSDGAIRTETGRVLKMQRKAVRSLIKSRYEFDQLEGL